MSPVGYALVILLDDPSPSFVIEQGFDRFRELVVEKPWRDQRGA